MSSIIDAGRVYQGLIGRAINTTLPRPIRVNRDRKSDAGPSSSWRKTSINTRFANVDVIDPLVNPTFVTTWNVSASPEGGWKIGYRDNSCRQLSDQSFGYTRLFWCRARIPRLIRATIDNAGRDLCSETFLIAFSRAGRVGRSEEGYIYRERKPGRERNRTIMMRFIGSIVPSPPNSSSQVQLMCIYRPPLSSVAIQSTFNLWMVSAREGLDERRGALLLLFPPSIRRIVSIDFRPVSLRVSLHLDSTSPSTRAIIIVNDFRVYVYSNYIEKCNERMYINC